MFPIYKIITSGFFFLHSLIFSPNIPHSPVRNRNVLILLKITLLLSTIMFWLKIKILIQVAIINLRSNIAFRPHKSWGQFMMLGLWVIPWTEERSSCGYDSTTVIRWCFLCISLSSIWNHSLVVSLATLCINTILYLSFPQSSFANTYLYPDHAPALQLLKYLWVLKKMQPLDYLSTNFLAHRHGNFAPPTSTHFLPPWFR